MKTRILPICAVIVCLFAVCAMPAIAAETQPIPPHVFVGTVTVNGAPAPVGTVIEVRGANVAQLEGNPFTVTQAGVFGGSGFDPKLLVQGNITPGMPLEFYVNGAKARVYNIATAGPWQDTFPFESLGYTELSIWVGAGDPVVVTITTTVAATQTTNYYSGGGGGSSGAGGGGGVSSGAASVASGTTAQTTATTSVGNQTTQTAGAGSVVTTQSTQAAVTTGAPAVAGTSAPPATTATAAGTPLGIEVPVIALSVSACAAGYLAARKK